MEDNYYRCGFDKWSYYKYSPNEDFWYYLDEDYKWIRVRGNDMSFCYGVFKQISLEQLNRDIALLELIG